MQTREGRESRKYNYERASIIRGRVSINGRYWYRASIFDYMANNPGQRRGLQVAQIRDFVIVKYTLKDIDRMRGKVRQSTLQGEIIFVRARKYYPRPTRVANMWVAPRKPTYHLATQAISVHDLCAFLHVAPERNGDLNKVNLIKVALAFV